MMNYADILEREVQAAVSESGKQVQRGQIASRILVDPVIEEFFAARTADLVKAILECNPTDTDNLRVLAIGIKALRGLHDHLTQAVTAGLTAAQRLNEQAKQGDTQ
jgi:hypothetical protein